MKTAEEKIDFQELADKLWQKWALQYEGRVYMTKDLFTLAIQDVPQPSNKEEEKAKSHLNIIDLVIDVFGLMSGDTITGRDLAYKLKELSDKGIIQFISLTTETKER